MGPSPAQMLRESVQSRENLFEVISAVRAYPFMMQNQNGISFKPDDIIKLIKNNMDPDGNLKRDISTNPIVDDTYGLRTVLSSMAPKQGAKQQAQSSQNHRRSMGFSSPFATMTAKQKQTSQEPTQKQPEQTSKQKLR